MKTEGKARFVQSEIDGLPLWRAFPVNDRGKSFVGKNYIIPYVVEIVLIILEKNVRFL